MPDVDNEDDFVHHEQPQFDISKAVNTIVKPLEKPKRQKGSTDDGYLGALRKYDIRAKIQNSNQLQQVFDTLEKVEAIHKSVASIRAARWTRAHASKYQTMLTALKIKLDVHMRFLNKVVPDLKSVELTDPDGNGPQLRLTVLTQSAQPKPPIDGELDE